MPSSPSRNEQSVALFSAIEAIDALRHELEHNIVEEETKEVLTLPSKLTLSIEGGDLKAIVHSVARTQTHTHTTTLSVSVDTLENRSSNSNSNSNRNSNSKPSSPISSMSQKDNRMQAKPISNITQTREEVQNFSAHLLYDVMIIIASIYIDKNIVNVWRRGVLTLTLLVFTGKQTIPKIIIISIILIHLNLIHLLPSI